MSAILKEAVSSSAASARYNIYRVIHKALRAFMADTLLKIGKMDVNDDGERAEALAQLRGLLAMCDSHLHHENAFIHTAIEKARPRATARTVEDHRHHEAALAGLEREIVQLESAAAGLRPALAQDLYLSLSRFVADNFTHMITEETENHAALTGAYDDSQVLAIEQSLVASLSPEQKFTSMRWMIPHINASERAFLLGGMKRHAPPPVFEAALGLARERLSQRDFYKLERALA
jgi:hypothetical protein